MIDFFRSEEEKRRKGTGDFAYNEMRNKARRPIR
jgi:stalled ribosome alternative rescue factor ArfA